MLKEIIEAIKIVRKADKKTNPKKLAIMRYVGKNDYSWRISFYNTKDHNFEDKVKERTNLDWKTAEKKISDGIDYLLQKWKKGKIKNKVTIAMTFKKSKFKVMYGMNPEDKFLKVITILGYDMGTKNAIKWDIDENLGFDLTNIEEIEIDL
jgi:hypothetical protein